MADTFAAHLEAAGGPAGRAGVWLRAACDAVLASITTRRLEPASGGEVMRSMWGDLGYGLRGLVRHKALSLAAGVTLALAIGANTAIFSVVNGMLLRPLPYEDPERLVMVWAEKPDQGWFETDVNPADAWDWRARAGVFTDLAVYAERGMVLTGLDRPEMVNGLESTPNLLDVLGVEVAHGRGLGPDDGLEGAPGAVLLAHGFWQRRFAGSPDVIGRSVTLDDVQHTIVGVLPADFRFLDEALDVITATRGSPASVARGPHTREALARLQPGVSHAAATEAVRDVARALQAEHPDTNEGWLASVESVRDFVLGDIAKQASFVLTGAVGFLMLIACANVANLLLARASARQAEMAVRTALGAGRGRLVRQLLTESLVLAVAGGAAGLALAEWGRRFIVAGLPENLPPVFDFSLDMRVLGYAAALTLGAALIFGLVPALRTAEPAGELRSGRRVRGGGALAGMLVIGQTALAVVLLVAGSVLVRSVVAMGTQDFGWDADRVLYVRVAPPSSRYPGGEELTTLYGALEERVAALPGVAGAGTIQSAPLEGSNWSTTILHPTSGDEQPARVGYVSPGYFAAMGVPLRAGRSIEPMDVRDGEPVIVINESFVRRYLPEGDPVGAMIQEPDGTSARVVGVVADHVERGVDRAPEPALYRSSAQFPVRGRTLVVRTTGDPSEAASAVREAAWEIDGDLVVADARPLTQVVEMRVGGFRLIGELMGAFAFLALTLAAVGIYGVTAHGVGQRCHEIGVRMALGADRGGVRRMVVGQGMRRAAIGVAVGVALAIPLAGALSGLAVGVDPRDPRVLGAVVATLVGVALLASWLPARRASDVDPVRSLAAE